ncbi:MAG: outer membrane protein assembly factor, partial [Flavobacteriales bacterium]
MSANAQISIGDKEIDYAVPTKYEIGGITVFGTDYLDPGGVVTLSGLEVGQKITIPGDDIGDAIRKLWKQKLFSEISISYSKIQGSTIFLEIKVKEQPRLSKFKFTGVRKSEADNLREKINLYREKIVTDNLLVSTKNTILEYFLDKGYLNALVEVTLVKDTLLPNHVVLLIDIDKSKHVKINKIIIEGNTQFSGSRVKRAMKDTKERSIFKPFDNFDSVLVHTTLNCLRSIFERDTISPLAFLPAYYKDRIRIRIFKSSKYLDENFADDKRNILAKYNQKGFRDAQIEWDTLIRVDDKSINLKLRIAEGSKYFFRNITWVGNTKHSTKELSAVLGIEKGDVYDQSVLESRLFMNPNGKDVSSVYMDDGYLFFNLTPVEIRVENDSIDLEMRIYEGRQARINKVSVVGNTKTNDKVILREIRTRPGELFSRADIIRTQRELAQLGFFDPEKLGVNPKPDPSNGTVDIEYTVAEKPSDQIELSGGWGGGRVVGTLGLSFTNFSTRNFFKKNAWRPLPSGDGQRLSIRGQSNGVYYQSYNISFTEPWLGGRKPNSFSITAYRSIQTNGIKKFLEDSVDADGGKVPDPSRADIKITGVSLGLGKRLTWPDDYFTLYMEASYQHYTMNKWLSFIFPTGESNNLFAKISLSRNSIDQPIYPRLGSQITLSMQATAPYSLFNSLDYTDPLLPAEDRYKWAEYHKWKFTSSWFTKLAGNLVLNTRVGFGFLGMYNKNVGPSPFERFYLGGSGLTGYALDGREIIALRGYDDQSLSPRSGSMTISKYTMELRYPFSLNPSATIYGLGFVEAGNTWNIASDFNPFTVKRSAGVGVRIFLPMFGLLGLDWGYRFDDVPAYPNMQR